MAATAARPAPLCCGFLAIPRLHSQVEHRLRRHAARQLFPAALLLPLGGPGGSGAGAPQLCGVGTLLPLPRAAPRAPAERGRGARPSPDRAPAGCSAAQPSPPRLLRALPSAATCAPALRAAPFGPTACPCALNPVSARDAALLTLGPRLADPAAQGGSRSALVWDPWL